MKLVVQIPCLNEAEVLPRTLADIPASISGIDEIVILVIDDGSDDGTSEVARAQGVTRILRHKRNLGLAFTFRHGMDEALRLGADVIVNFDADNQYHGSDIARVVKPILDGTADIVVGSRAAGENPEFSLIKRLLQRLGSFTVRKLAKVDVRDAVTGLRAFSREAALRLTILSNYTYTIESLLQARAKGFTVLDIPVETNPKARESRLMSSLGSYLSFSAATIIRVFAMYNPLRVFLAFGGCFILLGTFLIGRFAYYYVTEGGTGKVQSLVLAGALLVSGVVVALVGLMADLIQFNRRLLEEILERVRRLEFGREP